MVFEVENRYKREHKRFQDQREDCDCKRCRCDREKALRKLKKGDKDTTTPT